MACLSSSQKAYYQARYAKLLAQLSAIDDVIDSAIPNSEKESYKFDDGAGSQMVKRRSGQSLEEWRKQIESTLERYRRKLDGSGISIMRLCR
jgi:hypothetical protein